MLYAGFFLSRNGYNGPMNIVNAFEGLLLPGLVGDHDGVIETVLSKLFIRGDEVHKAYKHRTADFADLADRSVRRKYIAEDFFWNNIMAPNVYLELRGVRREGDQFVHVDHKEGEDWYIVMRKIDNERNLMRALEEGILPGGKLGEYVGALYARLEMLTEARKQGLKEFFDKEALHVREEVIGTRDWAYTAEPHLSRADVDRAAELMERVLSAEAYFQNPIKTLSVVIDTNPENIFLFDEGVSFIDVMPPKDAWRVHDRYFALCRTSADVSALVGKTHAEALHDSYEALSPLPPEAVRMVYEIAAALIQTPYRKMVGRDDLAAKYADYVRSRSEDLALLLEEKSRSIGLSSFVSGE
ncbi:MAG: hypothetical protein UY81_C0008G0011 [Candidatus Giovannonibacteria bacterium GW2011_GWA2_53_7]|uniref:Aminoglycoside phosphotransferase domain-containing protein n=1 Tax=Candidatus Giovannonibacteria bacterium GW2011_GWA2_53_7 TaxID=1618650 RepID=A0A0G2AVM5_9BACT|nr:MAG: hypothetical protein UY81_C0008G0011 [Candidatus Giovannonibacteria bacterium GW2011_GWA2_53_7]